MPSTQKIEWASVRLPERIKYRNTTRNHIQLSVSCNVRTALRLPTRFRGRPSIEVAVPLKFNPPFLPFHYLTSDMAIWPHNVNNIWMVASFRGPRVEETAAAVKQLLNSDDIVFSAGLASALQFYIDFVSSRLR